MCYHRPRGKPTIQDPATVSIVAYGIDALVAILNKLLARGNAAYRVRVTHYPIAERQTLEEGNVIE